MKMLDQLHPVMAVLTISLLAAPTAARPAGGGEPPRASPKAAAERDLSYFLGRWDIVATTPGTGETERFTYEVGALLEPAWIQGHGRSEKPGVESRDVWGKDAASGEYMRMIFDGSGTYAVVRSPGWQGDRLVLTGDARSSSGVVRVRETIERLDEDRFVATWEAYREGAWSAYSIERVTRRKAGPA
jgi:hypothetical protein